MDDPLMTALSVTGIGMLVLFVALVFLYGLMYLLTEFTKDRTETATEEKEGRGAEKQHEMRRRAAVIAVALARAGQESDGYDGPEALGRASPWHDAYERVSPWRAHHQQRQLSRSVLRRRVR
jgi:Na+-transporting methylmalonyl-CoA/oxaloacetate decarboxylase gamma subunit